VYGNVSLMLAQNYRFLWSVRVKVKRWR